VCVENKFIMFSNLKFCKYTMVCDALIGTLTKLTKCSTFPTHNEQMYPRLLTLFQKMSNRQGQKLIPRTWSWRRLLPTRERCLHSKEHQVPPHYKVCQEGRYFLMVDWFSQSCSSNPSPLRTGLHLKPELPVGEAGAGSGSEKRGTFKNLGSGKRGMT
jgi:hypothetical protein